MSTRTTYSLTPEELLDAYFDTRSAAPKSSGVTIFRKEILRRLHGFAAVAPERTPKWLDDISEQVQCIDEKTASITYNLKELQVSVLKLHADADTP